MDSLSDRLPLVIGVTGHRDLRDQDVTELEQEVAAVIARLRRDYLGGDRTTPIIVLSALAEGADRLVARVALNEGAQLIAPLPMPLEEYRRDFVPGIKPGNVAEFDALLAQAIAAPIMPLHGRSLDEIRADRRQRAEQYRAVGLFIAQHCHVLLALWDGNTKDMAAGGSAEVVTFKREGFPLVVSGSPRSSLDASEIGPVIEIVSPRMKETGSADHVAVRPWGNEVVRRYRGGSIQQGWRRVAAFFVHLVRRELDDGRSGLSTAERRELDTWESFEALIDLTQKFNRDAEQLVTAPEGPARMAQSADYLFTDPQRDTLDVDARARAMDVASLWCRLYAIADTLAQQRQSQFKWDWKLLFGLGFIAFFCFAMFTHIGHVNKTYFIGAYTLSFIAIFLVYIRAVIEQHQERYLDYRALAEALRVAVYWKLLGIGAQYPDANQKRLAQEAGDLVEAHAAESIANSYPIKQPSELAWVKVCLRTIERLDRVHTIPVEHVDPAGHAIARRFWVYGQYVYFNRQGLRHNSFAEMIESRFVMLLIVSPFLFAPLLLADLMFDWYGERAQHAFIVLIGLLPGLAAAFAGYSERLAFKAHARQYDRMRMLFERAYDLLPDQLDEGTRALARALYKELGIEAMREHAEWVAIFRQRPIQPLHGG